MSNANVVNVYKIAKGVQIYTKNMIPPKKTFEQLRC